MASIRKRKWESGGVTQAAWVVDYSDQAGKRRLKTFAKKKEADAWWATESGEVKRGTHTADSDSIKLSEAGELWIRHVRAEGRERSTVQQYEEHVKLHIVKLLGDVKLSKLTTPMVEEFKISLLETRSRPMAKKILTSLKMLLSAAQSAGKVAQNVASPVKIKGRRDRPKIEIPSNEDVNALITKAPDDFRPFLVIAVFTGMRASELRGLTWEHVDFDDRVIRIRQRADRWNQFGEPKSDTSRRDIPMGPNVLNTLREWKLRCPNGELDLVFPNGKGNVENLANIIKRFFAPLQVEAGTVHQNGKPKYGLHALRHFFASWLIDQDFKPKRVQELMGHSSISVTMDVYGHLFPGEDDYDKFAAAELQLLAT